VDGLYEHEYQETVCCQTKHDLVKVRKLNEARAIAQAHPNGDLTYLPGIPIAYPLFNLKNPLPLDWPALRQANTPAELRQLAAAEPPA
jgi:hypothetical protein